MLGRHWTGAAVASVGVLSACGGSTASESGGTAGTFGGAGGSLATGGGGAGGTRAPDAGTAGAAGAAGSPLATIACGNATCTAPDACLICDPPNPKSKTICAEGFGDACGAWGQWAPLRIFCDDQQDCSAGEHCTVVEGSVGTYAQCWPTQTCTEDCSCKGFGGSFVCKTLADCPSCATGCVAYEQSPDGPEYPIKVCAW